MFTYCEVCRALTSHTTDRDQGGVTILCGRCGHKRRDEIIEFQPSHTPYRQKEGPMIFRQGQDNRAKGEERKCLACNEKFYTGLMGPLGEICPLCRQEFGTTSQADAEELVDMLHAGVMTYNPPVERGKPNRALQNQTGGNGVVNKVDPAVVAQALRASIDYKVLPVESWDRPITYVTAKNGLFEVRHSDLATVITKPKEVLGVLEELKEGVTLNLPKLPFEFLQQTISFFRGVCTKHNGSSEALVQVWWDRQEKVHTLHVPEQTVSGASVNHRSAFDQDSSGRWFHVADIHSHGSSMSAFWSGTDNNDEQRVTTERLFGVIGKVNQPIPEWKWRMRTRDGFIDLAMVDVFAVPEQEHTFRIGSDALWRSVDSKDFKDGRVLLTCPVDPFTDVEVPASWYEQVKGRAYGHNHGSFAGPNAYPAHIKGFIYVDGREFEVDGTTMKATGKSLKKKEDTRGITH